MYMNVLVEDNFNNIRSTIINKREIIDLDLIKKSRKKTYIETLKKKIIQKGI